MNFGIGSAQAGLEGAQMAMGVYANDLANANTPGFATGEVAALPGAQSASAPGLGAVQGAVVPNVSVTVSGAAQGLGSVDTAPGTLVRGQSTDLALTTPGYFVVRTAQGVALTANGQFTRDAAGHLVTPSGGMLMSLAMRPVTVPQSGWSIQNGAIAASNGTTLAQLAIGTVPNPAGLVTEVGGLMQPTAQSGTMSIRPALGSDIVQGYVSSSNTNTAQVMGEMVGAQGQFALAADAISGGAQMAKDAASLPQGV